MINWILIAILVVVIFLLLKFKEIRHKLGFIVILFFLLFLGLSFWNVYKANDLDLNTFDGVMTAGKLYFSWLGNLFINAKQVTGYIVDQDWGIGKTNASDESANKSIEDDVLAAVRNSMNNSNSSALNNSISNDTNSS